MEDGHFESCLKEISAWGQKLWSEPSFQITKHCACATPIPT